MKREERMVKGRLGLIAVRARAILQHIEDPNAHEEYSLEEVERIGAGVMHALLLCNTKPQPQPYMRDGHVAMMSAKPARRAG
jgi:hypothetical protein